MSPTYVQPALQSSDIDRFAKWLSLSDEQKAVVQNACRSYEEAWNAIRKQEMPQLLALAEEAATAEPVTPSNIEAIEKLVKRNLDVRKKLDAIDQAFLAELEAILAEPQQAAMVRVRLDRDRSRSALVALLIPSATIDLSRLFEPVQHEAAAGGTEAFDEVMREYERTVTPLMTRLCETVVEQTFVVARIAMRRTHDDAGQPLDPNSAEGRSRNESGRAERARAIAVSGDLQQRIAQANDAYLPRLLEHFPLEVQRRLLDRYNVLAFPAVYPDPLDPQPLFQSILASQQVTDEERALLDAHWEHYCTNYDAVTKKMVDRYRDWRREFARTQSTMPAAYQAYRDDMRAWRDERWAVDDEFVERMVASINPSAETEFETALRAYSDKVRALQTRAAKDPYPGP